MPSHIDGLTTHLVLLSGGTGLRDDHVWELLGPWASPSPVHVRTGWTKPSAYTLQTPIVQGGTVWGDGGRDRARRTDSARWYSFFAPE